MGPSGLHEVLHREGRPVPKLDEHGDAGMEPGVALDQGLPRLVLSSVGQHHDVGALGKRARPVREHGAPVSLRHGHGQLAVAVGQELVAGFGDDGTVTVDGHEQWRVKAGREVPSPDLAWRAVAGAGDADVHEWDRDGYRGTLAVNAMVPGRSRELVITAVDVWTHAVLLRGVAEIDRAEPFWFHSAWGVATDLGSTHSFHGGGGSPRSWVYRFVPSLPAGANELRVFVGPEQPLRETRRELPPEPALTIDLATPLTVTRAAAVLDSAAASATPGFMGSQEGSPVRPTRVIPVSTTLDCAGERDLCVLNIDVRPEWFAVHIGGGGPLAASGEADARSPVLTHGWAASDDRGGRYLGSGRHSNSGFPWTAMAMLAPALDADASTLTLTFPYPFGSGAVKATVDLSGRPA